MHTKVNKIESEDPKEENNKQAKTRHEKNQLMPQCN